MSQDYISHRPTAKRLLRQIGSRYALSNQALLGFILPAYGSGLIFDNLRYDLGTLTIFLITTIGYLATVLPLLLIRRLLSLELGDSKPALVLSLIGFAGLIRGTTLIGLTAAFGQYSSDELFFRLVGAPIFVLATFSVAAVLVSNYQRHQDALIELADERHRLQLRAAGIRAKVDLQREELLEQVRQIIDPAINRVRTSLAGESKAAVESLRFTVDEVIRPLSAEVADSDVQLESENSKSLLREKAPLPERIPLSEFILPGLGAAVGSVISIPAAFLLENVAGAILVLLLISSSIYIVLWLVTTLAKGFTIKPKYSPLIIPFFYALSVTPLFILFEALSLNVTTQQVTAFLLSIAVTGYLLYVAQISQVQRRLTTARLSQINAQLEILNAELRKEIWLNKRRTAAVLHGPIQAALYASAMKLSSSETPTDQQITAVQKDIESAVSKLNEPGNFLDSSVSETLAEIVDIWSDVCEIKIELEKSLVDEIAADQITAEAVVEVAREFIQNAIKHGSATKITVNIHSPNENLISIECKDNGKGPVNDEASQGFGSKMLDQLTLNWSQQRTEDTTCSYAEIVRKRDNL
jgi:signal transduction histidine kinase